MSVLLGIWDVVVIFAVVGVVVVVVAVVEKLGTIHFLVIGSFLHLLPLPGMNLITKISQ